MHNYDGGIRDLAQNQNQPKYDPRKSGPEDPANPGHPLSENPDVKKAPDQAFMRTVNGTARGGLAESGFAIDYNTTTCGQNYKFTGKERDAESGLDDFDARFYSSSLGRFMSADWSAIPAPVPYANLTNPQTLNLYAMVRDNPESFADLNGHYLQAPSEYQGSTSGGDDPFTQASFSNDFRDIDKVADWYYQQVGADQQQETPRSLAAQIPASTRAQMAAAINDSNSPTADDKQGGFHEESGDAGPSASGDWVVSRDKPGPYGNPDVLAHLPSSKVAANQDVANSITDPEVFFHVHPSGTTGAHVWKQKPSPADTAAAVSGKINIVFGAGNKKVYFYNSSGVIGNPMSLKDFLKQ
jgi:RHS repeat-associated protein